MKLLISALVALVLAILCGSVLHANGLSGFFSGYLTGTVFCFTYFGSYAFLANYCSHD